jgi:monofunctional biosynthetic peptidoglycan transglycosylase
VARLGKRYRKFKPKSRHRFGILRRLIRWTFIIVVAAYGLVALTLAGLRWINPPYTAVHIERRIESWRQHLPYHKRYVFVPLARISPSLQHAAVAAEDARFFQHHGFDWTEIRNAVEENLEDDQGRGASTITQQLVKNLFLTTGRSILRKGMEFALVPLTEAILPKRRILELYLNVIEWGPGVYGGEAASRYYYNLPAAQVSREQAARLAAILPAPRTRKPAQMNERSVRIMERMRQMGW